MPAYPFVAVIVAYYLLKQANHMLRGPFVAHLVVSLMVPVLAYVALHIEDSLNHLTYLASGFLFLPAGAIVALILHQRRRFFPALRVMVGAWMITALIFFFLLFPRIDKENPVSMALRTTSLPNKEVAWYGKFNPAFAFYLQRRIPELKTPQEVGEFLKNENAVVITVKRRMDELQDVENKTILLKQKDLFERPTTILLGPAGR
jgi:hypothetical protein